MKVLAMNRVRWGRFVDALCSQMESWRNDDDQKLPSFIAKKCVPKILT